MLRLSQTSKSYSNTVALAPLSLDVASGQTTVLIGPSGCGKSTLLRLMNGLTQPSSGTVYFDNQPLSPENIQGIRHRMGYVIQDGGLFPHLSVRDNVTLLATQLGWPEDKKESRLLELTDLVQIPSDRLSSFPLQLSGGQQQRVSLMRALMLDPDVLLLDEPLGALDPMIRAELQTDLRSIFRRLKKTVVMVTHDLHEAGYFGDTILLLREGQVEQKGSFSDLLNAPASPFVEAFINAQRTVLDG
ncbi:MAG: ATP-binding cassette domain-containing protein [Rhodothermales bacterium]